MSRSFLVLISLFCFHQVSAISVEIIGIAEGRNVGTVYAYKNIGAFTDKRVIIDECEIDANGNFKLEFECTETQQLFISVNRVSATFFVHPGDRLKIVFPGEERVEYRSFSNSRVRLEIEPNANLTDTLFEIDSAISGFVSQHFFDYAFQQFRGPESYLEEARRRSPSTDMFKLSSESDSTYDGRVSSVKNAFDAFSAELNLKFSSTCSNYARQYLKYSLAELELMTLPSFNQYYVKHFAEAPVQLSNTAYVRTFRALFHGFFDKRAKFLKSGWSENLDSLNHSLDSILPIRRHELNACIWILHVLNNRSMWTDAAQGRNVILEEILEKYRNSGDICDAVSGLKQQSSFITSGRKINSLRLIDSYGERWQLNDEGSTFKYFLFFTKWNTESLRELLLLEKLSEQMKGILNVYAVSCDEDYNVFKRFVSNSSKSAVRYLYAGCSPEVDDVCGLKLIPDALFLDSDNLTLMSHTPLPSGKLEEHFQRIMNQMRKPAKTRKTWKD